MTIKTLGLYLVGDRQAIFDVATDRSALWIGLLFVLSAGFAREYDGQDLLSEPWHLLVPVGASLGVSFLLFLVASGPIFLRKDHPPTFLGAYRSFLALFWMTAPLAWLYAIPYERFLSPGGATSTNLWTLALVATWRVALMTRVVSVVNGRSILRSFFLVMVVADTVALTAIAVMPKPVFDIMGGIRLSASEQPVLEATLLVSAIGILSGPVWLIGALVSFGGVPAWQVPANPAEPDSTNRGLWTLGALSVLIWLPILPNTQAEQQLRSRVEREMRAGRTTEALAVMSAHTRSEFPPHWDPPPREGYGEKSPHIFDVMKAVVANDTAAWVRATYLEKFRRHLQGWNDYQSADESDELGTLADVLRRLPEGPNIAAELRQVINAKLKWENLSASQRENLNAILQLVQEEDSPDH